MRVLLDTNIVLDVLLNRVGLVDESESAIVRCEELGAELFVAWHGLATAYYLLKRGRTEAEALAEVDRILAWAQVPMAGDAEVRDARAMGLPDFEDALQAASAKASGADWIVTRDGSGFRGSPVPVISPTDFLLRYPVPAADKP
jgi:predicted nucleic acid-binding protein